MSGLRILWVAVALVGLSILAGCHRRHEAAKLPTAPTLKWPGVVYQEVVLPQFPELERLWVYSPTDGRKTHPCVFVAAAGSNLASGVRLSERDRPEHLPYVHAGYMVVAYDVSGPIPADNDDVATTAAIHLFAMRQAGIMNGRAAIDYAVRNLHADPLRLYTAGFASAGTLALLLASKDSRVRGCLAYAPITSVPDFLSGTLADEVKYHAPEVLATLTRYSPLSMVAGLRCPVMLFIARDDEVISPDSVRSFVAELHKTNKQVDLVVAPSGGHYDAMVTTGIPDGIEWLGRDRRRKK